LAIDAVFAELLVQTLTRERPRLVVECGSGSSTVLMAKVFRAIGRGRVVSLEHEAQYAQQTRELLKAHGVDEFADVLDSPLVERTVDSESMKWYDIDPLSLPDGGVDVLVVDGPPAILEHKARYPAVPLLWRHLSANCLILMDDGDREGEQEIAELWAATLGATLEYAPGGKGAWLLRNGGAVRHTQPAAEGPVSVVPRPRTEHEVRAAR
jgi:predicted O-methyltransferase YrrM